MKHSRKSKTSNYTVSKEIKNHVAKTMNELWNGSKIKWAISDSCISKLVNDRWMLYSYIILLTEALQMPALQWNMAWQEYCAMLLTTQAPTLYLHPSQMSYMSVKNSQNIFHTFQSIMFKFKLNLSIRLFIDCANLTSFDQINNSILHISWSKEIFSLYIRNIL